MGENGICSKTTKEFLHEAPSIRIIQNASCYEVPRPNGGIGRRVGLKIQCLMRTCRFESGFGHHRTFGLLASLPGGFFFRLSREIARPTSRRKAGKGTASGRAFHSFEKPERKKSTTELGCGRGGGRPSEGRRKVQSRLGDQDAQGVPQEEQSESDPFP